MTVADVISNRNSKILPTQRQSNHKSIFWPQLETMPSEAQLLEEISRLQCKLCYPPSTLANSRFFDSRHLTQDSAC